MIQMKGLNISDTLEKKENIKNGLNGLNANQKKQDTI